MADQSGSDGKPSVSFGFTKKIDTKKLQKSVVSDELASEDKGKDFVFSVVGREVKSSKPKESPKQYVIPLIRENNWRPVLNESDTDKAEVTNKVEDEAVREILADANKLNENWDDRGGDKINPNLQIPLLMQNKVPEGFETEEKLDVSLRPDAPNVIDYDEIPIDHFGKAMLRGMGWSEGKGIGKNEKAVAPVEAVVRPKGLGLGADRGQAQQKEKNGSTATNNNKHPNDTDLKIKKGAHCTILKGVNKDLYGMVEGVDEDNTRVMVKLALTGKVETLSQFAIRLVDKAEYDKYSKYLNKGKADKYKEEEERKKKRAKEKEMQSGSSSSDDSSDSESSRSSKSRSRSPSNRKNRSNTNGRKTGSGNQSRSSSRSVERKSASPVKRSRTPSKGASPVKRSRTPSKGASPVKRSRTPSKSKRKSASSSRSPSKGRSSSPVNRSRSRSKASVKSKERQRSDSPTESRKQPRNSRSPDKTARKSASSSRSRSKSPVEKGKRSLSKSKSPVKSRKKSRSSSRSRSPVKKRKRSESPVHKRRRSKSDSRSRSKSPVKGRKRSRSSSRSRSRSRVKSRRSRSRSRSRSRRRSRSNSRRRRPSYRSRSRSRGRRRNSRSRSTGRYRRSQSPQYSSYRRQKVYEEKRRRYDDYREREEARKRMEEREREKERRRRNASMARKKEKETQKKICAGTWVRANMRVRIIDKSIGDGNFFKEKVVVEDVPGIDNIVCKTSGGKVLENIKESQLETVIPKGESNTIVILYGKYKGLLGDIIKRDKENNKAMLELLRDRGTLLNLDYDSICEYVGEVDSDYCF